MCAPDSIMSSSSSTSKKSSDFSFAERTVSMSAGQLIMTLLAVAIGVFLATVQFYADRADSMHDGVVEARSSSSQMVPLKMIEVGEHMPNYTSRTVLVKGDYSTFSSSSKSLTTKNAKSQSTTGADDDSKGISINMGNVASEVGIVIALQAIFPVVNRLILVAKRVKWASLGIRVSPAVGRLLKTFGDVWHSVMLVYKKTSASKIVTRTKKMVKIFKHHDDHHDDHGDDHRKDKHAHEKKYAAHHA